MLLPLGVPFFHDVLLFARGQPGFPICDKTAGRLQCTLRARKKHDSVASLIAVLEGVCQRASVWWAVRLCGNAKGSVGSVVTNRIVL